MMGFTGSLENPTKADLGGFSFKAPTAVFLPPNGFDAGEDTYQVMYVFLVFFDSGKYI